MSRITTVAGLLVLLAVAVPGRFAFGADVPASQPLFSSHEPLTVILEADWRAIVRHRIHTDRSWPATLRFGEGEEDAREIPVRLSTRGLSRLDRAVCSFPPLFLHFEAEDVEGTLFTGQTLLPLVTHCKDTAAYQQYVVGEYLLYRVYGLLTEWSLDVRLARMTYEPTDRGRAVTAHAFFLENFHALAARFEAEVVEEKPLHPDHGEPSLMTLLEVFQYFVGNTDWSVVFQHNVALVKDSHGTVRAVPYDLDTAAAVAAVYAVPDENLGIETVEERLFRGFCRSRKMLLQAVDRLLEHRDDIEALYRSHDELDEREVQRTLDYYAEAYEELSDPEGREALADACRRVGPPKDTPPPPKDPSQGCLLSMSHPFREHPRGRVLVASETGEASGGWHRENGRPARGL